MEDVYFFRIIHLKNHHLKGVIATGIKSNPVAIRISEEKNFDVPVLLELAWQTLINMHGDQKQNSEITFADYLWQYEETHETTCITFKKLDNTPIKNPEKEFNYFLNLVSIDPLGFLQLSHEEKIQRLKEITEKLHAQKKHLPVPSAAKYLLQNEASVLQGILSDNFDALEQFKLSLAVQMITHPDLRIIKIANRFLLNPAFTEIFEKMAVKSGYLIWNTLGTK